MSKGHKVKDVLEAYTLPQIYAFVRAAEERGREEHLMLATAHRAAMQTDKGWRDYVSEARGKIQASRGIKAEPINAAQASRLRLLLGGKPKEKPVGD